MRGRLVAASFIGTGIGLFMSDVTDQSKWIAITILLAFAIALAIPEDSSRSD